MQPKWAKRLRWFGIAAAVLLVAVLAGCWLMFQHIPRWYQPVFIPKEQDQQVKDDLVRTSQGFTDALNQAGGPFEFRLTQNQINAWISNRERMWPLSREWLPTALSDPVVVLEPDLIRLAATYRSGGLKTVISAEFAASADREAIHLRMVGLGAGSLPVPVDWLQKELQSYERLLPAGQTVKGQLSATPLPSLSSLPEGADFPNAWLWQNGKLPFRVTSISVQTGSLVFGIEPLPRRR